MDRLSQLEESVAELSGALCNALGIVQQEAERIVADKSQGYRARSIQSLVACSGDCGRRSALNKHDGKKLKCFILKDNGLS